MACRISRHHPVNRNAPWTAASSGLYIGTDAIVSKFTQPHSPALCCSGKLNKLALSGRVLNKRLARSRGRRSRSSFRRQTYGSPLALPTQDFNGRITQTRPFALCLARGLVLLPRGAGAQSGSKLHGGTARDSPAAVDRGISRLPDAVGR